MDDTDKKSGNSDPARTPGEATENGRPQADSAVNVRIENGRIVIESVRPDADSPARPADRSRGDDRPDE